MYARYVTGIAIVALATLTSSAIGQVRGIRTGIPAAHNLPPAHRLLEPGPGVGGPGPGVLSAARNIGPSVNGYGAFGASIGQNVQVLFDKPQLMNVSWDVSGVGRYDSVPLVVPGRQNFAQGGIFRLKIGNIEGRPGVELYPTLELGRSNRRTSAYLAHSAIPIQFTQEDFDQVAAANFVTKVIYVPDPEYQELALAGVDTLVSTRLDPGVDPITEADRRGSILAIVRLGNKDLEVPGTDPSIAAGLGVLGNGGQGGPDTSNYISGVTGPHYGLPYTGTSIGIPGPAHIPLGAPAGLRGQHIHNHTAHQIPGPTPKVNIHVKQTPGLSYPRPADKVFINEHHIRPRHVNQQPPADLVEGQLPPRIPRGGILGHRR